LKKKPPRPPAGLTPSLFPTEFGLQELYDRLRGPCQVQGFFVGHKAKRTRRGRQLAIVCCVAQKVPKDRLDQLHPDARIPRALAWKRTRHEDTALPTDVVEIRRARFQQGPSVGPGDVLARPDQAAEEAHATLGVVIQHPEFGQVVTTAGHAFISNGQGEVLFDQGATGLRIFNTGRGVTPAVFEVRPRKAVVHPTADYALLEVTTPGASPRNLFEDVFNLSEPQLARPEDVGKRLFALTRRGRLETTLRGVGGELTIDGVGMRNLLFTDEVTEGGDSGCCLVDATFRVWGLLVGAATFSMVSQGDPSEHLVDCSVFAPANFLLSREKARLV